MGTIFHGLSSKHGANTEAKQKAQKHRAKHRQARSGVQTWKPRSQTCRSDLRTRPYNISVIQSPRSRSKAELKVQVQTWKPRSQTCRSDLRTRPYNISVIQGPRSRSKLRIQGPGPDLEA